MTHEMGFLISGIAAMAAGIINAIAGGGTLISFPVLVFLGIPAIPANITNTVALCPGYFGGTLAQKDDLRGQSTRLWMVIPAGVLGGVLGGFLLLQTGEKVFKELVPYLILLASALLALNEPLRAWLGKRLSEKHTLKLEKWTWLTAGLGAVYGGYFGAGLGVILIAALAFTLDESLTRLNAIKQAISLATNLSAAVYFMFSGQVIWTVALVMAFGALIGGVIGGKLVGMIKPATLRWMVVAVGVAVSVVYFLRG